MIKILYSQMVIAISILWVLVRGICCIRQKRLDCRQEVKRLLVYICLLVVVRFTFCPFGTVNGQIQPLVFDPERVFPLWVNFVPFVYLLDYPVLSEILVNLIGNILLFMPLGIVWPAVFPKLDTHWKVIAAGVGLSLCIEVLQLPFYSRATDVDDLILNSLGYLLGYGCYGLAKIIVKNRKGISV